MSVIIKGMAMPETCYECRFCEEHSEYPFTPYCVAHLNWIKDPRSGRLDTCPLEDDTAEFISVPCESYLKVICSKCGHEPIDNEDTAFYWLTPYCPFCGRKIVRMNLKDYRAEKIEECVDENWYTELDDPKIAERSEDAKKAD